MAHTADYIFDIATSDVGLNKRDAARFHAFNPNGVVASLPTDFSLPNGKWAAGCEMIGGRHDSYHAKKIVDFATGRVRFTRWDLDYAIKGAAEDGAAATAALKRKRAGLAA
jgi:hypothetical protein